MKPLTIEELKALPVGDWVWMEEKLFDKEVKGYVTVFEYMHPSDDIFLQWQDRARHYRFSDYGKTWLAYKNKEQAEAKGEILELPLLQNFTYEYDGVEIETKELVYRTRYGHIAVETYQYDEFEKAECRLKELKQKIVEAVK